MSDDISAMNMRMAMTAVVMPAFASSMQRLRERSIPHSWVTVTFLLCFVRSKLMYPPEGRGIAVSAIASLAGAGLSGLTIES